MLNASLLESCQTGPCPVDFWVSPRMKVQLLLLLLQVLLLKLYIEKQTKKRDQKLRPNFLATLKTPSSGIDAPIWTSNSSWSGIFSPKMQWKIVI